MDTRACRACLVHSFVPHPRWIMAPVTALLYLLLPPRMISDLPTPGLAKSRPRYHRSIRVTHVGARDDAVMLFCASPMVHYYVRARRCLSPLVLPAPTPRGSPRYPLTLAFERRVVRRREDRDASNAHPRPRPAERVIRRPVAQMGRRGWDRMCGAVSCARLLVFSRSLTTGPSRPSADGDGWCAVSVEA